jgi:2TM domain
MSTASDERARYLAAKKRIGAMRGVYLHAAIFAVVMIGLVGLNLYTGGAMWSLWPMAGWGIGLAAHAAAVFGRMPKAVSTWEQRKLRELTERR